MLREILFIGIAVALTLQVIAAKAVQEAKKESPQRFARSLVYDPEIDELFYDDEDGIDKRSWQDATGVWGKRSSWQQASGLWGKRAPAAWQVASGGWGKRSTPVTNGRSPNAWQTGSGLWGKRGAWQDMNGLWG